MNRDDANPYAPPASDVHEDVLDRDPLVVPIQLTAEDVARWELARRRWLYLPIRSVALCIALAGAGITIAGTLRALRGMWMGGYGTVAWTTVPLVIGTPSLLLGLWALLAGRLHLWKARHARRQGHVTDLDVTYTLTPDAFGIDQQGQQRTYGWSELKLVETPELFSVHHGREYFLLPKTQLNELITQALRNGAHVR